MVKQIKFIYPALICIFLLSGCTPIKGFVNKFRSGRSEEVEQTPMERDKAQLLRQIEKKFENPKAHFKLGQLYQAEGMWVQAEYEYNVALSFEPALREAQAAVVKVLIASGDTPKSKLLADIYMNQAATSAYGSLRLALAFQKQLLDEYALACYRQALHLAPNSAKINRQIGYYYLSRNNSQMAREYLSRSFQLNPKQADVAGELGRLGVAIAIPRKVETNTKKLDSIVDKAEK